MTVCIAAHCEHGKGASKVVCAVDGKLSHPLAGADVDAPKMLFGNDFIFMFAGQLSNSDLIMDGIRENFGKEPVKALVRNAYRKRMAQWSADRYLLQYDLDMSEFVKKGREMFGEERFGEISRTIEQDTANFQEQVLVVGWEDARKIPILFSMTRDGLASHALDGVAAIGSGADVAMSTMLVLQQTRFMTLEETIYSVAAAKFAAERCDSVGKTTTMCVSWKRTESDSKNRPAGNFVQPADIEELRKMWERHGKPKIPLQAIKLTNSIATKLWEGRGRQMTLSHLDLLMRSASRRSKRAK
jgi:ATP-dependent protease HslVU (ClpYQ) peptidase subunit